MLTKLLSCDLPLASLPLRTELWRDLRLTPGVKTIRYHYPDTDHRWTPGGQTSFSWLPTHPPSPPKSSLQPDFTDIKSTVSQHLEIFWKVWSIFSIFYFYWGLFLFPRNTTLKTAGKFRRKKNIPSHHFSSVQCFHPVLSRSITWWHHNHGGKWKL